MSQENMDFVLGLQFPAGMDVTQLFRNDAMWEASRASLAPRVHRDFECAWQRSDGEKTYVGIDGLRACFLDSMARWATYRADVADALDLGDSVLVLYRDHGTLPHSTEEVDVSPAGLYTMRECKLARWESYPSHAEALKAVGLGE
jgi:hypothetical protein